MNSTLPAKIAQLLHELVREEVALALRNARAPSPVAQAHSPLGRRRHIAAVRRRLAAGAGGAWKVGRMYYLTPEAMQEELALLGTPSRPKEEDRLDDMLGIVDIAGD